MLQNSISLNAVFLLSGHAMPCSISTFSRLVLTAVLAAHLSFAQATTYFLAPSGSDSNSGSTPTSPWKSFNYAVPHLRPGDTLILKDGRYTQMKNDSLFIAGINGTSSAPITFKAESERMAHLAGNGLSVVLRIERSSHLVIDGLHISSKDGSDATLAPDPVLARDSHHLSFRNMLVHHNNRYQNSHLMTLSRVMDSLIEDTELYYHHRHGILVHRSNGNTFRRIYCNSRGYGTIPGGFPNGHGASGGDVCLSIYPGSNNLVENVISEGPQVAFDIQATDVSTNNRFFGVIGIGGWYGVVIKARGNTVAEQPANTVIKDLVVINAESVGLYARGAIGTRCEQCTIIGSGNSGLLADVEMGAGGGGRSSFYATNILTLNNKTHGIAISQTDWLVQYSNSYNNGGLQYIPSTSTNLLNHLQRDPELGTCRVHLPDSSPMKGAGKNGKDIGAVVLYRYQDGVLTNIPLWDPTTGKFPCGQIVAGVNDIPGSSCFDVHQRLNVNTNGCMFPSSFHTGIVR
jgi:hypothetical protein